jgi:hypothetical protein
MHLTLRNFGSPQRGSALVLAAACFAVGLAAGAVILPVGAGRIESSEPPRREQLATVIQPTFCACWTAIPSRPRSVYGPAWR